MVSNVLCATLRTTTLIECPPVQPTEGAKLQQPARWWQEHAHGYCLWLSWHPMHKLNILMAWNIIHWRGAQTAQSCHERTRSGKESHWECELLVQNWEDSIQPPDIRRSGMEAGSSNVPALEPKGQDFWSEEFVGGQDQQSYCCYSPTASKIGRSIAGLRRK